MSDSVGGVSYDTARASTGLLFSATTPRPAGLSSCVTFEICNAVISNSGNPATLFQDCYGPYTKPPYTVVLLHRLLYTPSVYLYCERLLIDCVLNTTTLLLTAATIANRDYITCMLSTCAKATQPTPNSVHATDTHVLSTVDYFLDLRVSLLSSTTNTTILISSCRK